MSKFLSSKLTIKSFFYSDFFHLCDGIFTNYNWDIAHLERTSKFIDEKYHHRRRDCFFGIDIFGRGQLAKFQTDEVKK